MGSVELSVPDKIRDDANNIIANLLPDKSRDKYLEVYEKFVNWKESENIEKRNCSETVLLAYFNYLSSIKNYKSSSLWAFYSMLKTTIERNDNVNINYPKLVAFLKKKSVGYVPKKSEVFEPQDISKFLSEAKDEQLLSAKVILIFGIYGATRADELTKVVVDDVKQHGDIFVVKIPETKTNIIRSFTIDNEYAMYVRKYIDLRPKKVLTDRFFVNYLNGKCTIQPIGRNKFLGMPKITATYLGLPNTEKYTGHSFRRTSATLLADGGADIMTMKRHGGWHSSSVVEGYIAESISNKRKIGSIIDGQIKSVTTVTQTQSINVTTSDVEEPPSKLSKPTHEFIGTSLVSNESVVNELASNVFGTELVGNVITNDAKQHQLVNNEVKKPTDFLFQNQFNNCTVTIQYK